MGNRSRLENKSSTLTNSRKQGNERNDQSSVQIDQQLVHKGFDFGFDKLDIHSRQMNDGNVPGIQMKYAINETGDVYEQEADAMADKVLGMTESNSKTGNGLHYHKLASIQR